MRIVVTGRNGQISRALIERGPPRGATLIPLARPELDLARPGPWQALLAERRPDIIVSAAAYTAVDQAESERDLAFAVNAEGPRRLAAAAASLGVPLIQISTDYVFDGHTAAPWREDARPDPLNVYGASKLAGETAVLSAHPGNIVLRVGWVYSPFSTNFAKTMLRLARERDVLRVVADQVGGPSSAFEIAEAVLTIARNVVDDRERADLRGIFHVSPGGEASWALFAREIFAWLATRHGRQVAVEEISSAEYPTRARRPRDSRLDSGRLADIHNHRLPDWRHSLAPVLERLV